jgi:hypothetical protein
MADHHDHHHAAPVLPKDPVNVAGLTTVSLICAVVGFAAYGVLGFMNQSTAGEFALRDWFMTYLCGFVFWASLPLGSIFLILVGIMTSASWGVVLRRCFVASVKNLWLVLALFVPIAVSLYFDEGKQSPYWWADHEWHGAKADVAAKTGLRIEAVEENQHKIHDILNPEMFIGITVGGLALLGVLSYIMLGAMKKNDELNQPEAYTYLRKLAGPGVVLWVATMTIVSTLWVMSVEPTWASSMFPIVFGMNCFLTTFSFCIFTFYTVNSDQANTMAVVKDKFRIDMGTLTLAFAMVWAYASFSQYMLIWAGNLPEEVAYYRKRGDHGWEYLAYFLMAFHWLIPFVTFLFREVKTNTKAMRVMCALLFTVCIADVIWWILPCVPRENSTLHVPMAIAAIVGVGGLFGFFFTRELAKRPMLPANQEGQFLATWGAHH